MKIDLSKIDLENFVVKTEKISGEDCHLIIPNKQDCKWNTKNLIYRSSMWNSSGELVSAGLKKFFNVGESPDLYPNPEKHIQDWNIPEKIDGSTLIISKYKNNLIVRTRGSFNASKLDNGAEIEHLKQKYPRLFSHPLLYSGHSIICEWVSPTNVIILKYPEPDLFLLNVVKHEDYSYLTQQEVSNLAGEVCVKRPQMYFFGSMKEMAATVKEFKGKEGVVLYYNSDSNMVKLKGDLYLKLHKLKSELSSIEKVIDLFIELNYPKYNDFYLYIAQTFDFELAKMSIPQISKCCDAYEKVQKIIFGMQVFIRDVLGHLPDRKSKALKIIESYSIINRVSFVFTLMDKGQLEKTAIKKLMFQTLKHD